MSPAAFSPLSLAFACLVLAHSAVATSRALLDDGWITGRSTWYDDSPWMSVHTGSCMFGYLGDRFGGEHNWHVGAMNDGNAAYAGSCGKCFEIKCQPMIFNDNYGQSIDRTNACKNQDPVIIAITDTCPCIKPGNEYSNKRWCCGDMPHFDLGVWAFDKFADSGLGVVGIKYRAVACPAGGSWDGPSSSGGSSPMISSLASPNPASTSSANPNSNASPSPNPNSNGSPSPNPSPNPSRNVSPSPNPGPSPSGNPSPNPSPSPHPSSNPSPTPSPNSNPSPSPTPNPSPSPHPSSNPSPTPSPNSNPTPSPNPNPNPSPTPSPKSG